MGVLITELVPIRMASAQAVGALIAHPGFTSSRFVWLTLSQTVLSKHHMNPVMGNPYFMLRIQHPLQVHSVPCKLVFSKNE